MLSISPLAKKCIEIDNGYQLFADWCLRFFNGQGRDTTISHIYNSCSISGSNMAGNVMTRLKEIDKDFKLFLNKNQENNTEQIQEQE